jgi:hypothetical protein
MSGHVAKRRRRWPWAILSLLFALAFAWSLADMQERVGDVWGILRIGSAVGLGISLLLLVRALISSRRHRRAQKDDGRRAEGVEGAQAQEPVEQPPTYEEVFGLELDLDEGSLPRAPEDVEWTGDDEAELEAEAQPWAEQLSAEGAPSDEDGRALDAHLDEVVDQVDQVDALADGDPQEQLRRMREEFKARAEEAALRVKQREAELHGAGSAPDPKR